MNKKVVIVVAVVMAAVVVLVAVVAAMVEEMKLEAWKEGFKEGEMSIFPGAAVERQGKYIVRHHDGTSSINFDEVIPEE